jgi:hypothetical protein
MAFVNEYVAVEDYKYIPYPAGDRPMWTVDRSRNIFFMMLRRQGHPDGYPADSLIRNGALLGIDGSQYTFELTRGNGGLNEPGDVRVLLDYYGSTKYVLKLKGLDKGLPQRLVNTQFYIVWSIQNPESYDSNIRDILKEALTAYGYQGVYQQIPNTVVKFTF